MSKLSAQAQPSAAPSATDNFFDRARARLTLEVPPALTDPTAEGARGDLDLNPSMWEIAGVAATKPAAVLIPVVDRSEPTVLLTIRTKELASHAGQVAFPGGKIDPGETPEAALVRELREELGIEVSPGDLAPFVFASHPYENFHLLMPVFLCRRWSGKPTPREGQALAWVAPDQLVEYPMPPADRPLIPMLRDFL